MRISERVILMSETREFKTESKRILDLMINSIYTNKEIFLRELISNASDAIDKYHYLSLTNDKLEKRDDYEIHLSVNENHRTITISDNGIGMTYDELNNNLGTIASSGSKEFLEKLEKGENSEKIDIIGQFGVGFYSAFIVANRVSVETKSPFSDKGYRFTSEGTETYDIEEIDRAEVGTTITLWLRNDIEAKDEEDVGENYSIFLKEWKIRELVKKYSDYIRYPITMNVKESVPVKDEKGEEVKDKFEEVEKLETLNSMIPLWKKNKKEVSDEQLNEFYKEKFNDYEDPFTSLFLNVEGMISYNSLLFIPTHAPYDLYSEKYEKGLQLYTKGVFIMDKCKDLIPDYLRFVRGLVDSADLSLNISREMLQQSGQLKRIATNIEKKILGQLEKIRDNEYDRYLEFFKTYGVNLKWGIYENFGQKKELLQDLIVYDTVNGEKPVTLKKYVEDMKEGQEFIYYASAKTKDAVLAMPQMDLLKKNGYDVLILSDNVDEFVLTIMGEYGEKKFKSIASGDLDLLSKEENEQFDKLKEEKTSLLEKIKEALKDEVDDVVLSKRLTDSPVCLVSGEGLSLGMEKVLNDMPNDQKAKAERILEINPKHELFQAIEKVSQNETDLKDYAEILYNQALIIEGMPIAKPIEFTKKLCDLMIKAAK